MVSGSRNRRFSVCAIEFSGQSRQFRVTNIKSPVPDLRRDALGAVYLRFCLSDKGFRQKMRVEDIVFRSTFIKGFKSRKVPLTCSHGSF